MPVRSGVSGPAAEDVRGREGGIGRSSSPAAEAVSDALRRGTGDYLENRRRLAALFLGGMGSLGVVTAYQFGLLRRPPEPRLPFLDAAGVDASGEAYQYLKTPDATLGLASFAGTLVLVGMSGATRAERRPWIPLALAGKVVTDALWSAFLTAEQASKHRRFCSWCLLSALTSVAAVPQALPEARAAWRTLRRAR
jgi:FAD/FMN-containing dehydrogenase